MPRIEIDGRTPDPDLLATALLNQYGHFTAMQVRGRRARGLDLHLARLSSATAEVFGTGLDTDLVRRHLRGSLTEEYADSAVRIQVLQLDPGGEPSIVVLLRPPVDMPRASQRLRSVRHLRPLAHIKQVGGSFGQSYHGRAARTAGFDDALLTADDGAVSETSIANIGFFDGSAITWPDAPALEGITKQLLRRHGPAAGLASKTGRVTLDEVPAYRAAFVANSQGIAPVSAIDDIPLPVDDDLMAALYDVYESAPWDAI
ncbi:branched-subunit amino acid aminotransferase/4-amino-4-deoxychorismate lyase [Catenulispora sp. MAP5-51]|uniref:aminotransferase class IV n=1 Tax=Catenulispora sp. MAP5-51 TaxID=3156298 RepID=UPI0035165ECB